MIRVLNKPGTLEWRHRDGGGTGDYVMILDIHSWSSPRLTFIYRKPSQDTIAGELYASLQLVSVTDSSPADQQCLPRVVRCLVRCACVSLTSTTTLLTGMDHKSDSRL